jgi:AbiJ-like protein
MPMEPKILPPFSTRNRGAHLQVDSDFPKSARSGLLHLLHELIKLRYVEGWIRIAHELERIARVTRGVYREEYLPDIDDARDTSEELLRSLGWDKVLDFCERLNNSLAQETRHEARSKVQSSIATELNRLFLEESLAFEFHDGRVERRGRLHTSTQVSRAQIVLGDPRLEPASRHFNKAQKYFGHVSQPDPENTVKEAVCAVEATARALFPSPGAKTLGDIVKSITGTEPGKLPKAMAQTFHGLYGFRSGGEGVGHGGTSGGAATQDIAEYALALAASQIILLVDLANGQEDDIPI